MQKRIECKISGRVQMVMFRDFTERKARQLDLTGTVKNEPDGTVAVVAEGEEEALTKFITALRRGPLFARVDDVRVAWGDARGEFSDFRIIY